ncbi:MAG TPA: helicase HerA-like domain-containing protein [Solirubrobacteraceae bacterium]
MSPPARPRARRPYWLAPVFVAMLFGPPAWVTAAMLATAACVSLTLGVRRAFGGRSGGSHEREEGVVLGVDPRGREIVLTDRQLSAHGLILGASGAGKSTTLLTILTDHVRRGRPVIAIDMKGSPAFVEELSAAAAAAGRPFAVWSLDGPSIWNPLRHGNPTQLKDKLIATERFTEPHYQRAAERYVQMVLRVLELAHPGRAPTLADVVTLMDPRRVPAVLRDVPRDTRERVQDYLSQLTPDQVSAARGLGTRLAVLTESHTGQYLQPTTGAHEIDLHAALSGDEVVVFSLNSSSYGRLAAQLGTLAIQDLVSASGERLSSGPVSALPQAIVGIDEFSALGADHLIGLVARGREPKVSVVFATQELADMERVARGLREQLVGNAAVKIIHRQDVPDSALMVAQMAGTELVWERTIQTGAGPLGRYTTRGGTRRQVERFVVHPNQIKTLGTGDAIMLTKQPAAQTRAMHVRPPQRGGRELG